MTDAGGLFTPEPDETKETFKRRVKETLGIDPRSRQVSDTSMPDEIRDRAAGVLVASACGDALGAGYEFEPPERIPAQVGMIGGGAFGWEPGEWTDDTSMAWVIAEVAASGVDLRSEQAQDRIAAGWYTWRGEAKDIGVQTGAVLSAAARGLDLPTAATLRREAAVQHERMGRSGGNGSLMRTAPVALAYLDDPEGLVEAATQISALTHFDPEAGQACVLQCLAIRHAVLTGVLDLRVGVEFLEADAATLWAGRITDAESRTPQTFPKNGWVVEALLGAWSSIACTSDDEGQHLRRGLEAAVRGGNDTDTVAAIAGALLGAKYGLSAVPDQWRQILHGWPGKNTDDLVALALKSAGKSDGW